MISQVFLLYCIKIDNNNLLQTYRLLRLHGVKKLSYDDFWGQYKPVQVFCGWHICS